METIGPFRSEGTFRDWEMDAVVYFKFIHLVRMQGVKTDRQLTMETREEWKICKSYSFLCGGSRLTVVKTVLKVQIGSMHNHSLVIVPRLPRRV